VPASLPSIFERLTDRGCDRERCRYLYIGTSGGTLLVIDQEPGEGKMLRLVQMTPRVTANRGPFPHPPRALCSLPRARSSRPCSPCLLRKCACRHSTKDREPRHWSGGGKITAVTAVPFAGGPAGKVVVAGTSSGRVFSWMPFI
jgi:hypothetical protein